MSSYQGLEADQRETRPSRARSACNGLVGHFEVAANAGPVEDVPTFGPSNTILVAGPSWELVLNQAVEDARKAEQAAERAASNAAQARMDMEIVAATSALAHRDFKVKAVSNADHRLATMELLAAASVKRCRTGSVICDARSWISDRLLAALGLPAEQGTVEEIPDGPLYSLVPGSQTTTPSAFDGRFRN